MASLMDIVKALEGRSNSTRNALVSRFIAELGFVSEEQKFGFVYDKGLESWGFTPHKNHIVTIGKGPFDIIVSGHYDKIKISPGANDNASSVAVVLGVLDAMRDAKLPFALKGIIFGEEEKGLVGSANYIIKNQDDLSRIGGVINLEWVGNGDTVVTWPIREQDGWFIEPIYRAAYSRCAGVLRFGDFPNESLIGDHNNFLDVGIDNSVCLTLIDQDDLAAVIKYTMAVEKGNVSTFNLFRILKQAPALKRYHTPFDSSRYMSEESLRMCVDVIVDSLNHYASIYRGVARSVDVESRSA